MNRIQILLLALAASLGVMPGAKAIHADLPGLKPAAASIEAR